MWRKFGSAVPPSVLDFPPQGFAQDVPVADMDVEDPTSVFDAGADYAAKALHADFFNGKVTTFV